MNFLDHTNDHATEFTSSHSRNNAKGLIHILLDVYYELLAGEFKLHNEFLDKSQERPEEAQVCSSARTPFDGKDRKAAEEEYMYLVSPENKDILSRRLQRKMHKYCHALGIDLSYFKVDRTHYIGSTHFYTLISDILHTFGGERLSEIGKYALKGEYENIPPHFINTITERYYIALFDITMERRHGQRLNPADDEYQKLKKLMAHHMSATNDSYSTYLCKSFPDAFALMNCRLGTHYLLDPLARFNFLRCVQEDYDSKWSHLIGEYSLQKLEHFTRENCLPERYPYEEKDNLRTAIRTIFRESGHNIDAGICNFKWREVYRDE